MKLILMKHLECLDVHELVFHEARVFIRSSVHTFDKNCLVSEDLWQEIFHSSQILLMRERRAVVVLAAPDGDVGLPTIADPIFLINGAFCHDGGYQKVARAKREVVIR